MGTAPGSRRFDQCAWLQGHVPLATGGAPRPAVPPGSGSLATRWGVNIPGKKDGGSDCLYEAQQFFKILELF